MIIQGDIWNITLFTRFIWLDLFCDMFKKKIEILNKIGVERKHLTLLIFLLTKWLAFEGLNAKNINYQRLVIENVYHV